MTRDDVIETILTETTLRSARGIVSYVYLLERGEWPSTPHLRAYLRAGGGRLHNFWEQELERRRKEPHGTR